MWNPEREQSESTLEENGSWKYNQSHERKRLTSPLPARQSDGHIQSDLSISISPTKEMSEVFFPNFEHYKVKNGCFHVWNPDPEQSESYF